MTDKVNLKVDVVTPLKETFEQKSKKKTSWSGTTTDDNYPSEKLVKDSLDGKVDKVSGKGLSTEDYTSAEKTKLGGIETGANKTIVDSSLSSSSENPVQNKIVSNALDGKEDETNKVSSWSNTTTDEHYPSEKLVKDSLDNKITKTSTDNGFLKTDGSIASFGTGATNVATGNHAHGQITTSGAITSTAVTVASGDNIVITDASDSSKIKRVANVLTDHIKDGTAHTNIGSSANATQSTINSAIDTALSNKADSSSLSNYVLTSKILDDIDEAVDNTQVIGAYEMSQVVEELKGQVPTGVELQANRVSSWSGTVTNTHYPTEKLVKDSLDDKLDDSQLKTSIASTSSDTDIPSAKAVYTYVNSVPKWSTYVATSLSDLPQTGSVGVFYLVPNSSGETGNSFDEYFCNENSSSYEKFGSKTIDISNLVTMDDVLEYINNNGELSLPTTGNDAGYLVFTVS